MGRLFRRGARCCPTGRPRSRRCARRHYLGRTWEDLRWAFADHDLIERLGCGSVINVLAIYADEVIGSANLLHEERHYSEADIEDALPFVQLLVPALRAVPVSEDLGHALELVHRVRRAQASPRARAPLWTITRQAAHRQVAALMAAAGIEGPQACPRGLRHGYGVAAVTAGVPLPTVAAVLGHASLETTAIYTIVYPPSMTSCWPLM